MNYIKQPFVEFFCIFVLLSWIEQYNKGIIITTGDGKPYTPKLMNSSFKTQYQLSTFEFINVSGTLAVQSQPLGKRYNTEIIFDGEDHLDVSAAFSNSCNDTRPWQIEHPLYGIINVKCDSLDFNNDLAHKNSTIITGTLIETIGAVNPNVFIDPGDQIVGSFQDITDKFSAALTETPQPTDITQLKQDNLIAYKKGVPLINLTEQYQEYYNAFQTAQSYVDTATETPLLMMRSTMNLLTLPARFEISIEQRINLLNQTMIDLYKNILGFTTVSAKQLFQNKSGAVLGSMGLASVLPLVNDLKNSTQILNIIDIISQAQRQFIANLDSLQTPNGGDVTSFVADAPSLIALNDLINLTIAALFNLSLSARSERSIVCEKDTNWIILAHRLYGLDANDNNINDLIEANQNPIMNENFLNEYIKISKGRKVVYYI